MRDGGGEDEAFADVETIPDTVDEALAEAMLVEDAPGDEEAAADSDVLSEALVELDALSEDLEVEDASGDRDTADDSEIIEVPETVLVLTLDSDAVREDVAQEDDESVALRDTGAERVSVEAEEADRETRGLVVDDGSDVDDLLGCIDRVALLEGPTDREADDDCVGGDEEDASVDWVADLDAPADGESPDEGDLIGELEAVLLPAVLEESEADAVADAAALAEGIVEMVDVPDTVRVTPVALVLTDADSVGAEDADEGTVADGVRGAARVPEPVRVGVFVGCDDKDALLVLFGGFVARADFDDDTDMDDVLLSDALAETVADAVGRLEGAAEREAVGDDFTLRDGGADFVIDAENDADKLEETELVAENKAEAESPRGVPDGLESND